MIKRGTVSGKCSKCGTEFIRPGPPHTVICDCYKECPICGVTMESHTPTIDPSTYGLEKNMYDQYERLDTIMKCPKCGYLSSQKPIEVELR